MALDRARVTLARFLGLSRNGGADEEAAIRTCIKHLAKMPDDCQQAIAKDPETALQVQLLDPQTSRRLTVSPGHLTTREQPELPCRPQHSAQRTDIGPRYRRGRDPGQDCPFHLGL